MLKRILIFICIIEGLIILLLLRIEASNAKKLMRTNVIDVMSPDNKYRVILDKESHTPPLKSTNVGLSISYKVDDGWRNRNLIEFDVVTEGGVSEHNFLLEWFEKGVIIHVNDVEQSDYIYRVYWEDVFPK